MEKLDKAATTLSINSKHLIILVGILQGCLLHLLHIFIQTRTSLFMDNAWRSMAYSMVLVGPLVVMLSLRERGDKQAWISAALMTALFGLIAFYVGSQCDSSFYLKCRTSVFSPLVLTQLVALFIGLFLIRSWIDESGRALPYSKLFNFSWLNYLTVKMALVFTAVFWGLLFLWAALFAVIKVEFFMELFFRQLWFIYSVSGAVFALGIVIFRNETNIVYAVRRVLRALMWALLPLLGFIAVLFLIALPFTGLAPLWDTGHASLLMMWLIALVLFFVNAVYQDGSGEPPYKRALTLFIQSILVLMPVYIVLCAYSLNLRIQQYGWTYDRLWAVTILLILSGYVFSYAFSIIRLRAGWIDLFRPVNTVMALVIFIICCVVNTPILDFRKITVNSQISRLDSGVTDVDSMDYKYLRFSLGKPGYRALQALRNHPKIIQANKVDEINQILKSKYIHRAIQRPALQLDDIKLIPKDLNPPQQLLSAITNTGMTARQCSGSFGECYLTKLDLNGDAETEYVLLFIGQRYGNGHVFQEQNSAWVRVHSLRNVKSWSDMEVKESLKLGDISVVEPVWKDIKIGENRMKVR